MQRGCGCQAGFCSACATIYRIKDGPQLKFDLARLKVVGFEMYLTQVAFFPAPQMLSGLEKSEAVGEPLLKLDPDLIKSLGCNTCTKACPQNLDVMWCISDALAVISRK
jgi:hypothetical protein